MKIQRVLLVVLIGFALVTAVFSMLNQGQVALAGPAAVVIRVAPSGTDVNGCGGAAAPCRTIQFAVNQANDGDKILIATLDVALSATFPPVVVTATARYTGTGANVIELTKTVDLQGGFVYAHTGLSVTRWITGGMPAIVDGEMARRGLKVSGSVSPTVSLLAFVNGFGDYGGNIYAETANLQLLGTPIISGQATYGGGLYLKDVTIDFDLSSISGTVTETLASIFGNGWRNISWQTRNRLSGLVWLSGNRADYGGGLYAENSRLVLAGLGVYGNVAAIDGGGIYFSGGRPVVAGGVVLSNTAVNGGGVYLKDSPAIWGATAVLSNSANAGGGFYLSGPASLNPENMPILTNNYIRHNDSGSGQGGGFYFDQAMALLLNNVIADNNAAQAGGAYLYGSSPVFIHNTFAQNSGGSGIYLTRPSGTTSFSAPSFYNNIVASHTVGLDVDFLNAALMFNTLWYGNGVNYQGAGSTADSSGVTGGPGFVCTGDFPTCLTPYHLTSGSAAIDSGGDLTAVSDDLSLFYDIDGQLRPNGEGFDIGADELLTGTISAWLATLEPTIQLTQSESLTLPHYLFNTGTLTDVFDLALESDLGWGALLSSTPITLSGQTSGTIWVRVDAVTPRALAATLSRQETITLTATSRNSGQKTASVTQVTINTLQLNVYLPAILKP